MYWPSLFQLRRALSMVLAVVMLMGGASFNQILCIDSDGSVTVGSVESPCCGRCCTADSRAGGRDVSSRMVVATGESDRCTDFLLAGHPSVASNAQHLATMFTLLHIVPQVDLVPTSLLLGAGGAPYHWGRPDFAFCAGTARLSCLGTIIIRC